MELPACYVSVLFFPMQAGSYFVGAAPADRLPQYGGEQTVREKPYVRLSIQHIAIHYNDDKDQIKGMLDRIDNVSTAFFLRNPHTP